MSDAKQFINFDSTSWDSIEDTIDKINDIGCLQHSKTADGESIIFDVMRDEDGNDCLVTEVFQHNGFIRKNIYCPETLQVEELYERYYP